MAEEVPNQNNTQPPSQDNQTTMQSNEEARRLQELDDTYTMRAVMGGRVGSMYSGKRDIYKQAGYPDTVELDYQSYKGEYERHDIAQRVVEAFPDATWREVPQIKENDSKEETSFEKEVRRILEDFRVFHYLHRADILSCLGEYSVVLLGFDDVTNTEDMKNPPRRNDGGQVNLNYIQVFSQDNAEIYAQYDDPGNPKFGGPHTYKLTIRSITNSTQTTILYVHESRILHLAEDVLENDWIGTPCLKSIYNRLKDLDKIMASSAEGFWRAAWPGLAAKKDPEARWTPTSEAEVQSQFQQYAQGLSRVMRLEGVDIQELASKPASPKDHVDVCLDLIGGTRKIPKRILTGSEQGEMASTQDRENWHNRIMERRHNWARPCVVDQLMRKLDEAGVISIPSEGYKVRWPRRELTEREQTEIDRKRMDMIVSYAKWPQAEGVYPHYDVLTKLLHHTDDEAKAIMDRAENDTPALPQTAIQTESGGE